MDNDRQAQAYRRKLEAKLEGMKADLDKLQAKIDEKKADAELSYRSKLDDLQSKRRDLEQRVTKVKETAESAWEDVRTGLDKTWDSLVNGVQELRSSLNMTDRD